MHNIPNEILEMIYSHLLRHYDIINLSLVCRQLYNCMPNELIRVLNIRRKYTDINTAIKDIKYYIVRTSTTALSARISNRIVCSMHNDVADRRSLLSYELVIFDKIAATYIKYDCRTMTGESFFTKHGMRSISALFDETNEISAILAERNLDDVCM